MNEKQHTAVQWLEKEMIDLVSFNTVEMRERFRNKFKQALSMERKQMINFGNDCVEHYHTDWDMTCSVAEQLFTDTYQTEP